MKVSREQILVGTLFILVLVIFSLADRDTKRNERYSANIRQEVQMLANSHADTYPVKAKK
jgi:hypothetical protein